jgi:DNA polymerase-3 subunit delta
MQAAEYLKAPAEHAPGPLVVVFGADRFFKSHALEAVCRQLFGGEDAELGLTRVPGKSADLRQVLDDLSMVSMWGDRTAVLIEDGDDFVKDHRKELEKYFDKPAKKSVLILDVRTWASTTRLAKRAAEIGLSIDCAPLKPAETPRWLTDYCPSTYGKALKRPAAALLLELVGNDLGLLDTELAKLSAAAGSSQEISEELVRTLVGGWRAETTWSMLDAVRDGNVDRALQLLDKLLTAGEAPLKLLGGINYNFRPLADATEASRKGVNLREALTHAGVKPFNLDASMQYLKRIGRPRAELLYQRLLTADRELKGASQLPERLVFERLLLQLAGKL